MPDMDLFAHAEEWLEINRPRLEAANPGRYVLVDADTLMFEIADTFDQASEAYKEIYGETPFSGRHFLGQQLGHPPR